MNTTEERACRKLAGSDPGKKALRRLFCEAASKGWCTLMTALLDRGVGPNVSLHGRPAIVLASEAGRDHADAVRLLIDKSAAMPREALIHCGVNSLPILLAAGAAIDGHAGHTPPLLFAIVERTKQDKALALIEAGANPEVADTFGTTALMHAAINGRNSVFEALLSAGANICRTDQSGRTATRYALETLCSAHITSDSDRRLTKRIVRSVRDLTPGQPEDVLLLDIVMGDHLALEGKLTNGVCANSMIAGSIGILGAANGVAAILNNPETHTIDDILNATSLPVADAASGTSSLLMWAVAARQHKCISVLLAHGADAELMNRDGVSAFTLANSPHSDAETRRMIREAVKRT